MDLRGTINSLLVAAGSLVLAGLLYSGLRRGSAPWRKGSLAFVVVAIFLASPGTILYLLALDLGCYHSLAPGGRIASVTIREDGSKQWKLSLVSGAVANDVQVYGLRGDQGELDIKTLRFSGPLQWLGLRPVVKLERLGGRYLTLEEARSEDQTAHDIGDNALLDLWALDERIGIPFLESQSGRAEFVPLRHNAVYDVLLGQSGLRVVPVNADARSAMSAWR